jgi:chromosome segregation ATPase
MMQMVLQIIMSALAGGFAVRVIDMVIGRDQDAAAQRKELWDEIKKQRAWIAELVRRTDELNDKLDQKEAENERLENENTALRIRCGALEKRVAELEKQSGIPPIQVPTTDPHAGGKP